MRPERTGDSWSARDQSDPYPPHLPMTHAPFSSADPRKQIPFSLVRQTAPFNPRWISPRSPSYVSCALN